MRKATDHDGIFSAGIRWRLSYTNFGKNSHITKFLNSFQL